MNAFSSFLFMALGIALGVCGTYVYLKVTLQKLLGQVKDDREKLEAERAEERRVANEQLEGIREKLKDVREEVKGYWGQLQEETRKLSASEEMNARIPELEEILANKETVVAQLQREKAELFANATSLETKLNEQRKSFKEGLVFVHGNHYLPGSVIRSLTGKNKSELDESKERDS